MNLEFRKRFIEVLLKVARKHLRGGRGSIVSLLQEQRLKEWPNLCKILSGIDWAVVGAVATRLYIPERQTQDLDIAITKNDVEKARKRLKEAGFEYKGERSIAGSTWVSPEGTIIDVVECSQPWAEKAIKEAKENRDSQGLLVMPFEYLILMKFTSARAQDIADITRMLGLADKEKIEMVRKVFRDWLLEDLEDLESLIYLSRLEKG